MKHHLVVGRCPHPHAALPRQNPDPGERHGPSRLADRLRPVCPLPPRPLNTATSLADKVRSPSSPSRWGPGGWPLPAIHHPDFDPPSRPPPVPGWNSISPVSTPAPRTPMTKWSGEAWFNLRLFPPPPALSRLRSNPWAVTATNSTHHQGKAQDIVAPWALPSGRGANRGSSTAASALKPRFAVGDGVLERTSPPSPMMWVKFHLVSTPQVTLGDFRGNVFSPWPPWPPPYRRIPSPLRALYPSTTNIPSPKASPTATSAWHPDPPVFSGLRHGRLGQGS